MKNKQLLVVVVLSVIAMILLFNILGNKPKLANKTFEVQPAPQEAAKPKLACVDTVEVNTFFQNLLDEETEWQRVNYRFYFTAKRMAADPWGGYKRVIATEPNGGINAIKTYNKSPICTEHTVKVRMNSWKVWHDKRMTALNHIKASYPKIKEAE